MDSTWKDLFQYPLFDVGRHRCQCHSVRTDLAQKMKENFIYTAPNISLKIHTGEKAEIYGNWCAIECGSRKFQHKIYDVTSPIPVFSAWIFLQNLTHSGPGEERDSDRRRGILFPAVEDSKLCSVLAKEKTIYQQDRNSCREFQSFWKFRYA
ncbi:hypothetical protein AVEN_253726-1 [Araneus ventricosus]|uniref:Uncharacterized protein n=1 Tax=Araneus ventricosus TaxID=182803 RepID=A0A4Y2DZ62_ARAVE|nr:hypothetical protein AVEN_253726-1 [Araneus ventricosus]